MNSKLYIVFSQGMVSSIEYVTAEKQKAIDTAEILINTTWRHCTVEEYELDVLKSNDVKISKTIWDKFSPDF